MRKIIAVGLLAFMAGCAHKPPPAPPLPVLPPPPKSEHHAAKPVPPRAAPAPKPALRPEQPDDPTPNHVCHDLAKRRAQDAATLGVAAKRQHAIEESVYASCMGNAKNPAS